MLVVPEPFLDQVAAWEVVRRRGQLRRVAAEPCAATWGPRAWRAAVAPAKRGERREARARRCRESWRNSLHEAWREKRTRHCRPLREILRIAS